MGTCVLVSAGGRSVKPLHPGYAASVPLRQAGATQAAQSDAYKAAARAWQDEYQEKVAAACGLARQAWSATSEPGAVVGSAAPGRGGSDQGATAR